jgi:PadR family transcriptional regulator PadR
MIPTVHAATAQLRRGALEYCVLAVLGRGEAYGLELATTLRRAPTLFEKEGTLYPLLSRLRRQGWVSTRWEESPSGPPRRYYQVTADGRAALDSFRATWNAFAADVDHVLKGTLP